MAETKKGVDFKHPEYDGNVDSWKFVNNICDSKDVKQYINVLNIQDNSRENGARNEQFKKRAIFYAIAGYTSRGLVGKAFSKPPELDVVAQLEYIKTNVDGAGTGIDQQAQDVVRDVSRIGRSGLMVDFPKTGGELSVAQLASGGIAATITKFDAKQIINWKTKSIGSRIVLCKVVLAYNKDIQGDDGFSFKTVPVRLELKLEYVTDREVYSTVTWERLKVNGEETWVAGEEIFPVDSAGSTLSEIPFVFVGSESNTTKIDPAPMHDLCVINEGHLNNSAIYEDAVYQVGQPQVWMSGITQTHIDLMKTNDMYFGSRTVMGVPPGEKLGIVQVEPDTLAKEAMADKVQTMIGLGAMFITPGSANKTATQSAGELLAQHSVLSLIVSNVTDAYEKALEWVALFMGTDPKQTVYTLNQDFVSPTADANMLREIIAGFISGAIPAADFLRWQQRHNIIDPAKTIEEYQDELGQGITIPDLDA